MTARRTTVPLQPPLRRRQRTPPPRGGRRVLSLLFLLPLLILSCRRPPRDLRVETDELLYTVVTITIPDGAGDPEAEAAADAVLAEMRRVESLLNYYDEESGISRLNRERELSREEMGEEVWTLLHRCRHLWKETGGAFDVSVGPLIDLWKIGTDEERVPAKEEINEILAQIGLDKVIWEKDSVRLPDGMEIHLGGILKGYALERSVTVLRERGITAALINAGGDVYALGQRNHGGEWRVGIQHPRLWGAYFGKLEVSDTSTTTSGDYRQFFEIGGRRYHHILDPRTGYPAEGCLAATVIADNPVRADAWATAAVVLGNALPERLEGLGPADRDLQFVLVLEDGTVRASGDVPVASPLPKKLDW